jgi:uncharacterized membrane protein
VSVADTRTIDRIVDYLGATLGGIRRAHSYLAKIGVENVNSDLATFIRTIVVIVVLGGILAVRGLFQPIKASRDTRICS